MSDDEVRHFPLAVTGVFEFNELTCIQGKHWYVEYGKQQRWLVKCSVCDKVEDGAKAYTASMRLTD